MERGSAQEKEDWVNMQLALSVDGLFTLVHPQPTATRGIRHKCSSQEGHHCTLLNTVNRRGPWGLLGLSQVAVYLLVICILLIFLYSGNLRVPLCLRGWR